MGSSFGKLMRIVLVLAGLALVGWLLVALFVGKERARQAQEAAEEAAAFGESGQADDVGSALDEPARLEPMVQERVFEEIVAQPAPALQQSAPEPIRAPQLVIPMSEITFERHGGDVRGRAPDGSQTTYRLANDTEAIAAVALANLASQRADSLIPGCWYREESAVPDHVHATLATSSTLAAATCAEPRLQQRQGTVLTVDCGGTSLTLPMLDAAEADALGSMLQHAGKLPGRTWLRQVAGQPLVFQLQLDGKGGLTGVHCGSGGPGRDCCAPRPWPNP